VTRPSGNTTGPPAFDGLRADEGGLPAQIREVRDARRPKSPHTGRRVTGSTKTGSVTRRPRVLRLSNHRAAWRTKDDARLLLPLREKVPFASAKGG
jgi:hypothetical protein